MNKYIFILAEGKKGELRPITLELLTEGKKLAQKLKGRVITILLGAEVNHLCPILGHYGADTVLLAEDETLSHFSVKRYVSVLQDMIREYQPWIFLIGSTPMGREVAPTLAVKTTSGLVTDCNILDIDENDQLIMTKFIYGGQASVNIVCSNKRLQIATIQPGVVDVDEHDLSKNAEIIEFDTNKITNKFKPDIQVVGFMEGDPKLIDLADAEIIVSGGRGMDDAEHYKLIEDLAEVLSGSVGGSRVATDKGWIPHCRQVGLSGKTTTPKLFVACAISGAIQFQAGMKESKYILAINRDRYAPIFKIADLKILGDVHQVLPFLIERIKKIKTEQNDKNK